MADRISVLVDGAIVQLSRPERLFREPRDLRVARFLQLDNLHPVAAHEGPRCRIGAFDLELASPPSCRGAMWLAFATGDVMLLHAGDSGTGLDRNRFRGAITAFEQRHNHSRVTIAIEGGEGFVIEADVTVRDRVLLGGQLAAGSAVDVHIPPDAITVFPAVAT